MREYRQDDRNDGYCPVCAQPLTGMTLAGCGYCETHGWQSADWNLPKLHHPTHGDSENLEFLTPEEHATRHSHD